MAFSFTATTAVLIAVLVPIAFLDGNLGVIFAELAVTIGTAVIFSSLLALSLTAMMCSKLLTSHAHESWLTRKVDNSFHWIQDSYHEALLYVLPRPAIIIGLVIAVIVGTWGLLKIIPSEFAPQEDQGIFFTFISGPEGASFQFMQSQLRLLEDTIDPFVESGDVDIYLVFLPGWGAAESVNSAVVLVILAPWQERKMTTKQVMNKLSQAWQQIPGIRAFPFMRSGLQRHGGGQPLQLVLGGSTYEELAVWRDIILERAAENPLLSRVQADYKETKPQLLVEVDKTRAADVGVSVLDIGRTLQTMMSERRITTFVNDGAESDVIVQARQEQRTTVSHLTNNHVRSETD